MKNNSIPLTRKLNVNLTLFHHFLIRSFINGIPIYFILSIVGEFLFSKLPTESTMMSVVSFFLGFCLFWWLAAGVYFFIAILISKKVRENIFSWLFRFKERDEREEVITAKAAKSSFLLMAGVLFICFFISTFRLGYQPSANHENLHGHFTVGHIEMKPEPVDKIEKVSSSGEAINYNLYNFPLSKTGLIMLVLVIQFAAFRFFSFRYQKE